MEILTPYLVLLGVAVVFFIICYKLFSKPNPPKSKKRSKKVNLETTKPDTQQIDYGAMYYREGELEEAAKDILKTNEILESEQASEITSDENAISNTVNLEGLAKYAKDEDENSKPVDEIVHEEDATLVLPRLEVEKSLSVEEVSSKTDELDKTRVLHINDLQAELQKDIEEEKTTTEFDALDLNNALQAFREKYPNIDPVIMAEIKDMTKEAFTAANILTNEQLRDSLRNVVVHDAIFNIQRAYAISPTNWMKNIALNIFADVVQAPHYSMVYLIANRALSIISQMSLSQFNALSLTLLNKYAWNAFIYSAENLRNYASRYAEPFSQNLTTEEQAFSQLEYLQCLKVNRQNEQTMQAIFEDKYPLVFKYQGFKAEELAEVAPNLVETTVSSLINPNLQILPLINEDFSENYFNSVDITDESLKEKIMLLAKSRPVELTPDKFDAIIDSISTPYGNFRQVYDNSLLNSLDLQPMGFYLAKIHIKALLGEDLDISNLL